MASSRLCHQAKSIYLRFSQPISPRFILMLSVHLFFGLQSDKIPAGYPINSACISYLPLQATYPAYHSPMTLNHKVPYHV